MKKIIIIALVLASSLAFPVYAQVPSLNPNSLSQREKLALISQLKAQLAYLVNQLAVLKASQLAAPQSVPVVDNTQSDLEWLKNQISEMQKRGRERIEKMESDYARTIVPAREESQKYRDMLIAEQAGLNRQINLLEQNPTGMSSGALQSEIARLQRESLSRQADISLSSLAAEGRYRNALESFSSLYGLNVDNGLNGGKRIEERITSPFGQTYNLYSDGGNSVTVWRLGESPKTYYVDCSSYISSICNVRQLY